MSKLFLTILVIILLLPAAWLPIAYSRAGELAKVMPGEVLDLPAVWEPDRRLTRTQAPSQTSINFARSIAADEAGRVHLAWRDEQDGNLEIYYKRSPDGGVSWGPAIRLTNASGRSDNPSIAVSGDTVVVAWWDERTGVHQIWSKQSNDSGITWQSDAQVTFSPGGGAHCSLAVWKNARHVVYVDGRDGNSEVYYTRSLDAGATWSAPVRLSALPHNSYTPTIAVWQSNVYVAWTDTRHFGQNFSKEEEYFRRSSDGGTTFEPEQRLTTDPPESPADSWAPSLAARDQYVWISWFDSRDGNFEIYAKRSLDAGATWSSDTRLTTTSGQSQRPVIAQRGSQVFIVYWDNTGLDDEVYFLQSNDLGASWSAPERLTFGDVASLVPSVAAAASGVHVAWTDGRDQNAEVYYKRLPGMAVRVGNGRIAFTRLVNGDPQIFTVSSDGTNETQLTFAGRNIYPAWSKDGTKLAFSSNRSGAFEIWSMDPDGSDQEQITQHAPGTSFVPDWSYDGTRIAYAFVDTSVGHPEVWVMNADGTQQTRLTVTPPSGQFTWSLHPTWEPGDSRIYYASTASGASQVWGMFADGQGKEQKTFGLGPGAPHANVPEFGRDGKLTFWAGIEGQFGEVWKWDMPGVASPMRLTSTTDPLNSDNPSWAPDGTKLLFDSDQPSSSGGVNVWFITLDGSNQGLLIPGAIGQTSWQPVFGTNAIDGAQLFVRQHYSDFLNREPDASGLAFWTNEITSCGTDQLCINAKRINVSAAFYLSIEFQQTGYLVERIYKAAYGDAVGTSTFGGTHQLSVPVIRLNEFLPDTQQIGNGVVVNQSGWETVLENNKQAFTAEFVVRSRFTTAFPQSMTPSQFVDTLNTNAGNPLSQSERNQLVSDLSSGAKTRAQVLRAVAEDPDLNNAEFNRAFVLMQYFGYLRRNPNDPHDTDYSGYDFWLGKLNQFNGNFANAEMVKAFIVSTEYRQRFGP